MSYQKRGRCFWFDKHLLNCFWWFSVYLIKCIQCKQPSLYYFGEYEFEDVKQFLESQERCKFNPYSETNYFTAKPNAEEVPCKKLLKKLWPGSEWYEITSHHVQFYAYAYGVKHSFNFNPVKCSSAGYMKIEMIVLCEIQTEKRNLSETCKTDLQCSGTEHASVCGKNRTCTCEKGYVEWHNKCLPGNLSLGQSCKEDLQCTGTENGGKCFHGECFCKDGFVQHRVKCLPDKRHFRESCEAHIQCSGTENANVCGENKTCTCNKNFARIQDDCMPGNLSLGQSCTHNLQCTGTINRKRCLDGECFCKEGFVLQRLRCLLGQPCTHNVQCTDTVHGEKCLNGECFCEEGFVPQKDTCIHVHVPNKGMVNLIELIGKDNWLFASTGVGVFGTMFIYSAVLLDLKRRKSGKKILSHSPKETIRRIHYYVAEEINLQCVLSLDFSGNYYAVDNIYSELHQKEKERESENVYNASQPQCS